MQSTKAYIKQPRFISTYGEIRTPARCIVGPLPTSPQGHRYLVTMIDRTTRWPEAIPTDDTSAESVARIIYENWITRFVSPKTITTDQGRNFESNLFLKLLQTMGIQKTRTTAYHPQSNGIVERWHRILKTALKTRLSQHTKSIDELPTVLLGLRATPRADTSLSATQLTYGCSIRLPCDFFTATSSKNQEMNKDVVTQLRESINKVLSSKRTSSHGNYKSVFIHQDLKTCKQVFVRNDAVKKQFQPTYDGPTRKEIYNYIDGPTKACLYYQRGFTIIIIIIIISTTSEEACKPIIYINPDESYFKITRHGRVVKPPVRFR
ncbi:unnamed protein product [Parnassius mnemosyne]|uniref:Integrase catalytic domain-containing protein n=1 Tax=Parnassius mnemosyne TaxID=213953 RepID=A0AAV1L8M6_9NEOP